MDSFSSRLNKILNLLNNKTIVAKALNYTNNTINVTPGYCWSLNGFLEIWSDGEKLMLPYKGTSLYGLKINENDCQKWPFKWGWEDVKGHAGKPEIIFTPKQINEFKKAETHEEILKLDEKFGLNRNNIKAILRDVVKSVKPAIIIQHGETYTGNFEVIINSQVKMTKLANGTTDELGQSVFDVKEININMKKL